MGRMVNSSSIVGRTNSSYKFMQVIGDADSAHLFIQLILLLLYDVVFDFIELSFTVSHGESTFNFAAKSNIAILS